MFADSFFQVSIVVYTSIKYDYKTPLRAIIIYSNSVLFRQVAEVQ